MGSHINTFFKGNPYSMDHLFSETCVLSLASSQTGEQLRSKKLYESSPHCMLWHWRSPQDEMQFQGETKGNGELHLRGLSRKSEYIFWSVSINQSINIKTIPWNLTALQELHSKPSKHHCTVTLRKHSKLMMGYVLENRPEDSFFYWHVLPAAG